MEIKAEVQDSRIRRALNKFDFPQLRNKTVRDKIITETPQSECQRSKQMHTARNK